MDYHKEYTKAKIMLEASDPMNPDVSVEGLGTYDLRTLKNNVMRSIGNLLKGVNKTGTAQQWRNLKHELDSGVIQAKVDAIVAAHDDIQAKRRKGGPQSRGINKE